MFTRSGVRGLDRAAVEELGIPGIVLMENAAASVERAALRMLHEMPGVGASRRAAHVQVFCGPGNNGGDGFALARRLHVGGISVCVFAASGRGRCTPDAETNLAIVEKLGIPLIWFDPRRPYLAFEATVEAAEKHHGVLLVDALVGTGLDRAVGSPMDEAVNWINTRRGSDARARVLAVDIPTGLDCDSGAPMGDAVVRADATVTLAGWKTGFANPESARFTGAVELGEIGVPRSLIERFAE